MFRKTIDPLEKTRIRVIWLVSGKSKIKESDLAYHSGRSLPLIYNTLRPVRALVDRTAAEVSAAIGALFQAEAGRQVSAEDWDRIYSETVTECRTMFANIVLNGHRLIAGDVR